MQDADLTCPAESFDAAYCSAKGKASGRVDAIERSIAQTLSEFDADDSGVFEVGATPLDQDQLLTDGGNISPPDHGPHRRQRRQPVSDAHPRVILAVMFLSTLTALTLVGFAVTEGFIP